MNLDLSDPTLLRTQAYIDGKWVDADDGATLDVLNPANGECVAKVAKVGAAETERAIAAAERAFASWRLTTAKERAARLREWFNLMMAAQEDLARILTAEMGKVLIPHSIAVGAYACHFGCHRPGPYTRQQLSGGGP